MKKQATRLAIIGTIILFTFVIQSCKPPQGPGTHWSAGQALDVMNGRYQVIAGPTWPGNAERDSGYTFYRISVEEASDNSRRTIFQKDIPFAELPKDMAHRHAPEIATFDIASMTVHFNLGTHRYKYKIEAEQAAPSNR